MVSAIFHLIHFLPESSLTTKQQSPRHKTSTFYHVVYVRIIGLGFFFICSKIYLPFCLLFKINICLFHKIIYFLNQVNTLADF